MHDIYYDGLIMYVRTYMSCMYFVRMYDVLILYIIYSTIIQHESKLTPTLFSLSQSPPSSRANPGGFGHRTEQCRRNASLFAP